MNLREIMIKALTADKYSGKKLSAIRLMNGSVCVEYLDDTDRYIGDASTTMLEVLRVWDGIELLDDDSEHYNDMTHYLELNVETVNARMVKEEYHHDLVEDAIDMCIGKLDQSVFVKRSMSSVISAIELQAHDNDLLIDNMDGIDLADKAAWYAKGKDKPAVREA